MTRMFGCSTATRILASVGTIFWLAISCQASLQEDPIQTSIETTPSKSYWDSSLYPVVHSLKELRTIQKEKGLIAVEVDLKAQLTFAEHYWTVFFVQDGDFPAMIHCTDAATAILHTRPFGTPLRIQGLVFAGQPDIKLLSISFVESSPDLNPLPVQTGSVLSEVAPDTYVELNCSLHEFFSTPNNFLIHGMYASEPIEIWVGHSMIDMQLEPLANEIDSSLLNGNRRWRVRGILSPKQSSTTKYKFAMRLQHSDQIQRLQPDANPSSISPIISRPPLREFEGRVLYSDHRNQVLVKNETGVALIHTNFAFMVHPGEILYTKGDLESIFEGDLRIQSHFTQIKSTQQLEPPSEVAVEDLVEKSSIVDRVLLKAEVIDQTQNIETLSLKLSDGGRKIEAIIVVKNGETQGYRFRPGDLVRVRGVPFKEVPLDPKDPRRVTLFVDSMNDVQLVRAASRITGTQLLLSISSCLAILGFVVGWNRLLKKQVSSRTKSLNEISIHLRKSFEAVTEGILLNDQLGRVSNSNHQFRAIFGVIPVEGRELGEVLASIRPKLKDPTALDNLERALKVPLALPMRIHLELSSPEKTVQAKLSAINDLNGQQLGNLWSFEDITEKIRLEAELVQSQKMEAVGQLSGGIAHDFNNILTIAQTNLALLDLRVHEAHSKELVESIVTAMERGAKLTQHLLDFSRRSRMELKSVEINRLATDVLQLVRPSIDKSIAIELKLFPEPLYSMVDPTRLDQVLINICLNARDAIIKTTGRISIITGKTTDSTGQCWVTISIRDNGMGMSKETQARIFEPFFTTKKVGEGTGLGLSMSLGVIQQLGGQIHCESHVDQGTEFLIKLPSSEAPKQSDTTKTTVSNGSSNHLRILMVDDEEMIIRSTSAMLKHLGHSVRTANNGREALDAIAAEEFDIVLLDLTMPEMSGKEAFLEIARRYPDLPVTICSGYVVDLQEWGLPREIPIPSVIQKPYSMQVISEHLRSIVRRLSKSH